MNPKTIELSEWWHQSFDEPMGYAVADNEGEYRLFYELNEAQDFAAEMEEKHDRDEGSQMVFPLFAADPKESV